MRLALAVCAIVVTVALFAMTKAPMGLADPTGTAFRTAAATALLLGLGRVVGAASHRRPPQPLPVRMIALIVVMVTILVLAVWFSPDWSILLAVWYATLFLAGVLLNRWCDAAERHTLLVATFSIFLASLILIALSAASTPPQIDLGPNTALIAIWRNVARIATIPGDAAWVWLAWRLADRLRAPEARRKKLVPRIASRPVQKRPV